MKACFATLMTMLILLCACSTDKKLTGGDSEYKKILENQRQRANAKVVEEEPAKRPELTAEGYEGIGDRSVIEGNYVKAILQYGKALELSPGLNSVRYKAGRLLLKQRLKSDALCQFDEIVKTEPSNAYGYYGKALVYLAENQLEKSKDNLVRATTLDSGLWQAQALLGLVYDLQKQHGPAIEQYEKSLAVNRRSAAVYNNLGISLYCTGSYERSIQAFRRALQIEPASGKIWNNLALSLYMEGRHKEAFEAFRKARDGASAYNNMGYLLMAEGSYEKSLDNFAKAMETSASFYVKASENMKQAKAAIEKENTVR